jgi:hypothetical protein
VQTKSAEIGTNTRFMLPIFLALAEVWSCKCNYQITAITPKRCNCSLPKSFAKVMAAIARNYGDFGILS